ncbi:hypothetical protein [Actinoplanes sp. NPDC026670]|uniref:hypothetical protein n=1 Tax=Actinoplanes sp. NPDC026670 TaxID=3154700 RepID=UPI0033C125C4
MIEWAADEVIVGREDLAGHVRDALAAAGLPVVPSHVNPRLVAGGAQVRVDRLADCHAPVRVDWRADRLLMDAVMERRVDTPAFAHFQVILQGMLRVMKEILASEGFEVRDTTNDFAPFTIEVLGLPQHTSSWTTSSLVNDIVLQDPAQ